MNASILQGQLLPELAPHALALPLISAARFAELSGIPEGVVRGWLARGYIPTYSIGKYTLINLALLNQMAMRKAFSV